MNIGGRLLMRYGPPPEPGPRRPRGSGVPAALAVGVIGFLAVLAGAAVGWESETFAKWFLSVAAVAIIVGSLVHANIARHASDGQGAGWLGHRTARDPMTIALCILAGTVFVCWQVLGHHWGWPFVFTGRRRRRWWRMPGGP